jgi:hypothetical protein
MKKQLLKPKIAMHHAGRLVKTNSPTLLSALAVVGVAGTAYLTFKATWQASKVISDKETMETVRGEGQTRTPQEKALLVWKLYIPAAGVGALTIASIVASNRIQVRRLAAMAAAYGVLTGDFDEYRNKALEMLGEKKAKTIDDKMAEEKMTKNPPPQGIPLEDGESWFCDLSTMRYFKSDRGRVDKARNDLNYHLMHGGDICADLNAAYGFLGLPSTGVGGLLGWTSEQVVEFVPTPIFMPNGDTATGIKFVPEPAPDFSDLH